MPQKTSNSRQPVITEEDFREYRELRPYIARCLSLNHELNNPLAGVLGYAEFLKMDAAQLSAEQNAHLDQIITCAERLRMIIQDLCKAKIELSKNVDLARLSEKYCD